MNYENETKELKLGDRILKLLLENGFPVQEYGTYFYKDVIEKGAEQLSEINTQADLEYIEMEMLDPFSQFYFDVARNDNDFGVKSFHDSIQHAFLKIVNSNKTSNYIDDIISRHGNDYKRIAFQLSCHFGSELIVNKPVNKVRRCLKKDKEN